ncbi:MAG: redox-regulated ATPase YchF [Methanophagales archaeon ANME-1-THS]|nr:MAG: redox-regulated ATPase YchF [Methanophagales archaeon ANME-1-THS]
MITIAIAGKPNSGKSTFFKASTLADVAIAAYPFTTIAPNQGIAYVKVKCPCKEEKVQQATRAESCGNCIAGFRFVPVELLDIAGLVRGAHEGRGLGNEFLDELRRAEAIIQVVDASGGTDADGNIVEIGSHDPVEDLAFFETELNLWVYGLIKRNWRKLERKAELEGTKIERLLAEQLAGVGVTEEQIKMAILASDLSDRSNFKLWTDEDLKELARHMLKKSKKMVIAANKVDIAPEENVRNLNAQSEGKEGTLVIPCSAEAELALRTAAKNKLIAYVPGEGGFETLQELTEQQKRGLERIRALMQTYGGTGVQDIINRVVFDLLDYVVAYPVEDEHKFTDSAGRILPDAFLLKRGSTARDLAFAVHSDIGKGFLFAIDARTKLRLGEKYALKPQDIIKVVYSSR